MACTRKQVPRRNPLKSGQCFLHRSGETVYKVKVNGRNPLKSGQCFLLIFKKEVKQNGKNLSQSPQIGSMFLTSFPSQGYEGKGREGRNPLKSGQCFLLKSEVLFNSTPPCLRRNPLKSGQCFLLTKTKSCITNGACESQSPQIGSMFLTKELKAQLESFLGFVAIPSNRVNVSYKELKQSIEQKLGFSRNPLKSGQCFLLQTLVNPIS